MRALAVCIAVSLAAPAAAQELKPFDFKGYAAGSAVAVELFAKCTQRDGEVECTNFDDTLAGVSAITSITFYNGRMTGVMALLRNPAGLADVMTAFIAKYGKPCETRTDTWRNGAGAVLENPVTVWCFSSGKLTVKQLGIDLDTPSIVYTDEHQKPAAPPRVDF